MTAFEQTKQLLKQQQYTWLVTGVAGFIGSHLLEFLLAHQQKVIGLDNFATGHRHNLDEVLHQHPQHVDLFRFIKGDIRQLDTCMQACKQVDFVLHQAALGSVPRSIKDPLTSHAVNVDGFLNMLWAAKENAVQRLVYASSSSVYGDSPLLPKQESHQGNPLSPYAVTKLANELYAKAFGNCYDLATIGLRYFNVFGPRQNPNGAYAAVIPLWAKALQKNHAVYINGDGETSRDFCYVKNVVQANILAALTQTPGAIDTAYNIAVGDQTSLNQLYTLLRDFMHTPADQPEYRSYRAGDIRHSLADISKARHYLGYAPTHSAKQGLQETVQWYLQSL